MSHTEQRSAFSQAVPVSYMDPASLNTSDNLPLSNSLAQPIVPTHRVAERALGQLDIPHPNDAFPINSLSPVPSIANGVASAAAGANVAGGQLLPGSVFALSAAEKKKSINAGAELVQLGLKFEQQRTSDIAKLHAEIQKSKAKMDALLKLSTHLQKLSPDNKTHQVTAEIKAMSATLREKGIDLIAEDAQEISADQLLALRSTISSHLDSIKTMEMQIPFMKSEKLTSELKSLYESLQKIIQLLDRLVQRSQGKVGK